MAVKLLQLLIERSCAYKHKHKFVLCFRIDTIKSTNILVFKHYILKKPEVEVKHIFVLGIFTYELLYLGENNFWYPLDRKLGKSQSQCGHHLQYKLLFSQNHSLIKKNAFVFLFEILTNSFTLLEMKHVSRCLQHLYTHTHTQHTTVWTQNTTLSHHTVANTHHTHAKAVQ